LFQAAVPKKVIFCFKFTWTYKWVLQIVNLGITLKQHSIKLAMTGNAAAWNNL